MVLTKIFNNANDLLDMQQPSIELNVEIYKDDDKYNVHISHDGSSGVNYRNISTTEGVGKCVEDYLENNIV